MNLIECIAAAQIGRCPFRRRAWQSHYLLRLHDNRIVNHAGEHPSTKSIFSTTDLAATDWVCVDKYLSDSPKCGDRIILDGATYIFAGGNWYKEGNQSVLPALAQAYIAADNVV